MSAPDTAWPLGTVTVLGAHILDVLGRPVETIPPGQGSVRLQEIRATAAGTAAGTGVDLAKLGARVLAVGALGDDLLGDIVIAAMARHGVDTTGLVRKKEPRRRPRSCPSGPTASAPPSTSRARRACSPAPTSTWSEYKAAGPCSSAPRTRSPG